VDGGMEIDAEQVLIINIFGDIIVNIIFINLIKLKPVGLAQIL
jgi:hypothetical protein